MPLILASNSASGGYNVANSLRFNSASADYLSITQVAGNRQIGTLSCWVKKSRASGGDGMNIFSAYANASFRTEVILQSAGDFRLLNVSTSVNLQTSALFRDVGAWYHFVIGIDTTQATASDRVKMYVNGVQVTSFSAASYPAQNSFFMFNNGVFLDIGRTGTYGNENLDGYLSEYYWIEGQQLTPSSFGQTDPSVPSSGIWQPKAYTGSFGTNGFYLQFKNSAALGTDSSGNGNNFTVNNLTSVDQSTDTCTNNFATLNPLSKVSSSTLTEGNLKETKSNKGGVVSTLAVNKGKWYCEVKIDTVGVDPQIGIYAVDAGTVGYQTTYLGVDAFSMGYLVNNDYVLGYNAVTANSYGSAFSNGDIMIIALDMDNKKMWFGKNGTWFSSGNPATGANPVQSISAFPANVSDNFQAFATGSNSASENAVYSFNFGSPSFTIASGNADGAGFGNFEYSVPSGFYSLCTKNLANFG